MSLTPQRRAALLERVAFKMRWLALEVAKESGGGASVAEVRQIAAEAAAFAFAGGAVLFAEVRRRRREAGLPEAGGGGEP
jgi:hypothetical protein